MTLIECCLSNVSFEARTALDESEHRVRETVCLDRCGDCHATPFLVVDGDVRTSNSHRALLQSVDGQTTGRGE